MLLMIMPMLMMLAMTPMLLLDELEVVAYAVVDDANADAKMPSAGAYVVLLLLQLLPMMMLLRDMLRGDACDDVMLNVYAYVVICFYLMRECV